MRFRRFAPLPTLLADSRFSGNADVGLMLVIGARRRSRRLEALWLGPLREGHPNSVLGQHDSIVPLEYVPQFIGFLEAGRAAPDLFTHDVSTSSQRVERVALYKHSGEVATRMSHNRFIRLV